MGKGATNLFMKKIVFITGATAGFGEATAQKFAQNGHNLILNGRRKERLEKLKSELEKKYGVQVLTLPFDVRDKASVQKSISSLPEDWKNIDILVNNAGLALGLSTIDQGDTNNWDIVIDTNVKGLLYVSREVMPLMVQRKKGHIINLGSIAGKNNYRNGNIYVATKHAVDSISECMRVDLLPHQIKVTAIHPGAAETEFSIVRFGGDTKKAKEVYAGFEPLRAPDIAEIIYFVTTMPDHVCINDLVVTPTAQANAYYTQLEN